jgi:hypothetical protein
METEDRDRAGRIHDLPPWRIGPLAVLAAVGVALIAFVIFLALFITHYGDRPPTRFMRVENHTDKRVVITMNQGPYQFDPETKRVRVSVVPPNGTVEISGRCDLQELVARDSHGSVIATHEPSAKCDEMIVWVVGGDQTLTPP